MRTYKVKGLEKIFIIVIYCPLFIALFLNLGAIKPKWIQADLLSALIMWCNIIILVFWGADGESEL